jgi:hypothetical protein
LPATPSRYTPRKPAAHIGKSVDNLARIPADVTASRDDLRSGVDFMNLNVGRKAFRQ